VCPEDFLSVDQLAYVYGQPAATGLIRAVPEDFRVDEDLGFSPDGVGEHVFLQIQKKDLNTDWVAQRLAKLAGVKRVDVGFCGLKDRYAETTQWFSLYLPGKEEPDWSAIESANLKCVSHTRHSRKLRRGSHRANHFILLVRNVTGDLSELESRLSLISGQGVPNYFGAQRFGRQDANLHQALAMFNGSLKVKAKQKRSLYLSAARSYLFNQVLSQRVAMGNWNEALPGDVMMLNGTNSFFATGQVDEEIKKRLHQFDIHPSGPLWGQGELHTSVEARALEWSVLEEFADFRAGLERAGLKQQRRALRLLVHDMQWEFLTGNMLQLQFRLESGAYATSVLRELVDLK
jgi:tRNA pseudouridine13 synthase